jgi:DNA-binding IclR family transcriptional regulator
VTEYANAPQERGYKVLLALAGHEFAGLAPGDIAKAIGTSASNVTRDLRVLQKVGLAQQNPETGGWYLGPKIVQIAQRFVFNLDRARRRVDEINQRYSRDPS